jgi:hydrogenase-4 component B
MTFPLLCNQNMGQYLILAPVILSFLILIVPERIRHPYALLLTVFTGLLTSIPSIRMIFAPGTETFILRGPFGQIDLVIDGLSGFFILVTNFTMLTGVLFAGSYLKIYREKKNQAQFALHYFSFIWLHLSMLGVLMLRDGLSFLIAWELMAVSSFMLILFEAEKRATLKTAVNYLIQMHVGLMILVIAFLICEATTGEMSFDALQIYFSKNHNAGLFLLFFAGFAIKAGFIPFHTWLPEAHPAAPTHVSAVMSGAMIKMGIYGIIRVITHLQADLYIIGWILLVVSAISGVLGVMMATVQKDMKRVLAYSSIENIGIIGMGIGLGTMGLGLHNPILAVLGFTGGLLHVLNHSLFKSLMFYGTGVVYRFYHTRNMEQLGGVVHKLPQTAALYLTGAAAICGLPPLSGFISEFLIYLGLIRGLSAGSAYQAITIILAIVSLVLIGGLAIFCFTRVFGMVFLGMPRIKHDLQDGPDERGMLFPQYLIVLLIVLIGFFPLLFLGPISDMVTGQFHLVPGAGLTDISGMFLKISLISGILVLLVVAVYLAGRFIPGKRTVSRGPTWACGYTAGSARQQYTATSYAANFGELANPVLNSKDQFTAMGEEEIFPGVHSFERQPQDLFRKGLNRFADFSMLVLKKLARLQTGNIRHYILYAFVFILVIFILLYLKIL